MRGFLALALAAAAGATHAEPAPEFGARLSEQATAFVEQIVGRGRGRALVAVEAQRSRTHSERELSAPLSDVEPTGALPGYAQTQTKKTMVTSREVTESSNDLEIKKIHATIVLDDRLGDAAAAAIRRMLPQILQMDGDRGDDIVVVKAPLRPIWRDALESAEGLRAGLIALAVFASVLVIVLAGYLAALAFVRALSAELEARRPAALPQPAGQGFGPLPALEGEVVADGLPSMTGQAPGGPPGTADGPAQLGQRFDFLSARKPAEWAALLSEESVEYLAQLFAQLAKSSPDLAGLIFAALPPGRQSQVSQELVGLRMLDPDRLSLMENRLRTLLERALRGPERLGAILSRLPVEQREDLLGEIVTNKPDAAAEVEKAVFSFEDILRLSPVELRRLLSSLTYDDWGTALQEAPEALVKAVADQLPEGAAGALRETMAAGAPRARVLAARSRVLNQVRALMERGQIASETASP